MIFARVDQQSDMIPTYLDPISEFQSEVLVQSTLLRPHGIICNLLRLSCTRLSPTRSAAAKQSACLPKMQASQEAQNTSKMRISTDQRIAEDDK